MADCARPDDKAKMVWSGDCMAYLPDADVTPQSKTEGKS
jgi:hypothetical protein